MLELGEGTDDQPLLPLLPGDTSTDRIVATKSYDDMFHRLVRLRRSDTGKTKGVVLTGQPGIGVFL